MEVGADLTKAGVRSKSFPTPRREEEEEKGEETAAKRISFPEIKTKGGAG